MTIDDLAEQVRRWGAAVLEKPTPYRMQGLLLARERLAKTNRPPDPKIQRSKPNDRR